MNKIVAIGFIVLIVALLGGGRTYAMDREVAGAGQVLSLDMSSGSYEESSEGAAVTSNFSGKVVAVDPSSKELTVMSSGSDLTSGASQGEARIATDESTSITACEMSSDFSDIKVGQSVDIKYHNISGNLIADEIRLQKTC